jgi:hypothetical protein
MQKVKRKQSKDEENDSSSRKRRKADLRKPVSFVSTGNVEISRAESIIIKIFIGRSFMLKSDRESSILLGC